MIAKRITSKAAKPRMARLVRYVVAAEGGIDPRSWERTADYVLCSKTNNRGEKVGGVRVTNCNTDDPAAATTLIEVTQAANTRSKTDKTYHLVFSFPPGEQPSLETLHKIEDELVASIGYAEHQRISAVHIDTDHLHVHVAINKVHPKGFQNIEPYFDKKKLMEACERLEIEHGLQRTNHGLDGREPKSKVKAKQAQAEIHSGIETLTGHVTREIAPKLKEAKSWNEAHEILAEHGVEIKQRGAGLVIGSGKLWVKASNCDRALSFKAMTDRLGPFEKAPKRVKTPFEPKPRQSHASSSALYARYQSERETRLLVRKRELEQLKYQGEMLEWKLRKWHVAQRLLVNVAAAKGPKRRAMLKIVRVQTANNRATNRKAINERRRQLVIDTALPSWQSWLAQQASTEALAVLRSRQEHEPMQGNYLTAKSTKAAEHIFIDNLQSEIDRKGSVTYRAPDGGVVIDHAHYVQCFRTSVQSPKLALDLAADRFRGQKLIVEGQENFQKEVARLAGLHSINIRFSDPAMEQIRKQSIPSKEKTRGKSNDKGMAI